MNGLGLTASAITARPARLALTCELRMAKELVLMLDRYAASTGTHTLMPYDTSAHPRFDFSDPRAELADRLAYLHAGDLLKQAGVLDPEDRTLRTAISAMDHRAQATFAYALLSDTREGKQQTITWEFSHRPAYQGAPTDAEIVRAAVAAEALNGRTWAGEKLTLIDAALAQLGSVQMTEVEVALAAAAAQIRHVGDYGQLWWHPGRAHAWWVAADSDGDPDSGVTGPDEIRALLGAVPGVSLVTAEAELLPTDADTDAGWQRVPHAAQIVE